MRYGVVRHRDARFCAKRISVTAGISICYTRRAQIHAVQPACYAGGAYDVYIMSIRKQYQPHSVFVAQYVTAVQHTFTVAGQERWVTSRMLRTTRYTYATRDHLLRLMSPPRAATNRLQHITLCPWSSHTWKGSPRWWFWLQAVVWFYLWCGVSGVVKPCGDGHWIS